MEVASWSRWASGQQDLRIASKNLHQHALQSATGDSSRFCSLSLTISQGEDGVLTPSRNWICNEVNVKEFPGLQAMIVPLQQTCALTTNY